MVSYTLFNLNNPTNYNQMIAYLTSLNINTTLLINAINTNWGSINTLITASIFDNKEVIEEIKKILSTHNNFRIPFM